MSRVGSRINTALKRAIACVCCMCETLAVCDIVHDGTSLCCILSCTVLQGGVLRHTVVLSLPPFSSCNTARQEAILFPAEVYASRKVSCTIIQYSPLPLPLSPLNTARVTSTHAREEPMLFLAEVYTCTLCSEVKPHSLTFALGCILKDVYTHEYTHMHTTSHVL